MQGGARCWRLAGGLCSCGRQAGARRQPPAPVRASAWRPVVVPSCAAGACSGQRRRCQWPAARPNGPAVGPSSASAAPVRVPVCPRRAPAVPPVLACAGLGAAAALPACRPQEQSPPANRQQLRTPCRRRPPAHPADTPQPPRRRPARAHVGPARPAADALPRAH